MPDPTDIRAEAIERVRQTRPGIAVGDILDASGLLDKLAEAHSAIEHLHNDVGTLTDELNQALEREKALEQQNAVLRESLLDAAANLPQPYRSELPKRLAALLDTLAPNAVEG